MTARLGYVAKQHMAATKDATSSSRNKATRNIIFFELETGFFRHFVFLHLCKIPLLIYLPLPFSRSSACLILGVESEHLLFFIAGVLRLWSTKNFCVALHIIPTFYVLCGLPSLFCITQLAFLCALFQ